MRHYGNTLCKCFSLSRLPYSPHIRCRFQRRRFNWPELDPFGWESEFESDDDSVEQTGRCTLPATETTDGLTPIRLFEIFEVVKSS